MKRQRLVVGLLGAAVLGVMLMVFSGEQGLMTFYRTWRQMQHLLREIKHSRTTVDSLTQEADRLKNDTAHIERIAREKYGMAGKNEKMYKFIEEK